MPPILELRGITKRFPGVLANDHIDLTLNQGEIHALLGENGAGKSTLMNVLYGLYHPDEGEILVRGNPIRMTGPRDAIAQGIGMVHQHFMLIPVFTVTENVMLGDESITNGVVLDRKKVAREIRELSTKYGLEVNPDLYIKDLSVGVQQRVEIIKLLYRKADILILDEPTAVLTPQEADDLFQVLRNLKARGNSIIFITHKLREVLELADRITVLRLGKVVGSADPQSATSAELARMMVGRSVILSVDKEPAQPKAVTLAVQDLVVRDERQNIAVNGVSFQVHAGEVLGIAGVQGNGQTELAQALTGLRKVESGQVTILGEDTTHANPRKISELRVAHVPEDRQADGLVLNFPVEDNLVLNEYYRPPFAKGIVMNFDAIQTAAEERVREFDVRTPSIFVNAGNLSGGNQQKVIVAREFSRDIALLIASQPTRGLDVGSIEYIHKRIIEKRDAGVAVLLVSNELDEIMSLSDRVAVMFKGEIIDTVNAAETTKEALGLLMAGVHEPGASPQPQTPNAQAETLDEIA
ncbi:MAG: Ribose import ATP-binding protein RbsA [Anaerolineae bacterium]|nr:Ribose import ATP-binding protein RbsA [Anaerolineae bacterium]